VKSAALLNAFILVLVCGISTNFGQQPPPDVGDKIIFVGTAGDDAAGDGSPAHPYKTFSKAVSVAANVTATINFLPGQYLIQPMSIPGSGLADDPFLIVKAYGGQGTVSITPDHVSDFQVGISRANVTLKDLKFFTLGANSVLASVTARNLLIDNCVFDQSQAQPQEKTATLRIEGSPRTADHFVIKGCTFIGPRLAALQVKNPIDVLHFIGNTVLMAGSASGIIVETDGYSGIVVSNNIFHYTAPKGAQRVLQFNGSGSGTKINLNCLSSASGPTGDLVSEKLATNSVINLVLAFRPTGPAETNPGASIRGSCFDIFQQENHSVLKPN
jgi:hypothetical protein